MMMIQKLPLRAKPRWTCLILSQYRLLPCIDMCLAHGKSSVSVPSVWPGENIMTLSAEEFLMHFAFSVIRDAVPFGLQRTVNASCF